MEAFQWAAKSNAHFMDTEGRFWQTVNAQGSFDAIHTGWTLLFGPQTLTFLYANARYDFQARGYNFAMHLANGGLEAPGLLWRPLFGLTQGFKEAKTRLPASFNVDLGLSIAAGRITDLIQAQPSVSEGVSCA